MAISRKWMPPLNFALIALFLRLLPHPPHFTLFGGLALCGGSLLPTTQALWLVLLPLLASDLVYGFHNTMPFVYGAFICITLLGKALGRRPSWPIILGSTFASSLIFFVLTNFGVWLTAGMYPLTLAGLGKAFTMALPFYRTDWGVSAAILWGNFFISTLISATLFLAIAQRNSTREKTGSSNLIDLLTAFF